MIDLDKILPLVQKPSRYINHEINSYKPDMDNDVSICLCFPDIYEIGAFLSADFTNPDSVLNLTPS